MPFWKKKRAQVEAKVDEVAAVATALANQSLIIGPGGAALLLGAAAVGAVATYVVTTRRKRRTCDF